MNKQQAIAETLKVAKAEAQCRYAICVGGIWNAGASLDDLAVVFNHVPAADIIEVRPSGAVIYPV